jgi:large subunit ribosomal protein L28
MYEFAMRMCSVTKRTTSFGHRVAHCNKKTKRTFQVNMISKRVWVPELNKFVRVKLSARGLKTLDKNGPAYLIEIGAI